MRNSFLGWLLVLGSTVWVCSVLQAQLMPSDPPQSLAGALKAGRWQKRVLLLCAPTATDAALLRQRQLLASARSGLEARDLVVREVLPNQLSAADKRYLTETLRVSGDSFVLLLLGKDGGVKRRETGPVTPASLFNTIDVMPMRQQEMKKQ